MFMTVCKRIEINFDNAIKLAAIFAVAGLLAACGGDSGSGKGTESAGEYDSDIIVTTFDDLPVCSDKREGATAYVNDEKSAYICEDGDWSKDGDSSKDHKKTEISSSSDEAKSSSNGAKDSDPESSDDGKRTSSSSNFEYTQDSTARDTLPVVTIKNKSISGVTQKGPFVTGSAVKLYELDGKTFAQTGKSFTGKIASDDGKFSVASVTLASQYALLEANGYFRNEVTDKKSSGTITLNALSDLSDRKSVNINLLTHLEYERALYLVGSGINVSTAKKQAEAEIFNAFGIQGEFANSEDLDIFSKGEGNAALLAFSVLMLRDLSEADLTELLSKFAMDIEKDGSWDDAVTKAKIADWAQSVDLSGWLATFRSNIEKWNLGTVPEFENYVRIFWNTNYGLGSCTADNEGEVMETKNELSSTYGTQKRFICKRGAWVGASDVEKDTYGEKCASAEVGKTISGKVTSTNKYYCTVNGWVSLMSWSWDVPKEARLNPDITYGTLTDSRDGKKYKTVTIGDQTWMAENLNYYDANDLNVKNKSWCYGKSDNKDSTTCDVAGRLYTWAAAIDSVKLATAAENPQECGYGKTCTLHAQRQGVCPTGWHLPTNNEWEDLIVTVGVTQTGIQTAGNILKSQNGWSNGTDAFGFSALPAGQRSEYGDFGLGGYFWSAVEYNESLACYMFLEDKVEYATLYPRSKSSASYVRCVEN